MQKWKKNLYLTWFAQILSLMGFGFIIPFIPFFIQELGISSDAEIKQWTGLLSSVTGFSLGIAAPIWGYLADRIGKKWMMLRSLFFAFLIMSIYPFITAVEHILILRLLQGFLTGTITASAAFVASNVPENKLSYALGFLSSSTFIGYSLGPLLGGIFVEYLGYRRSFFAGGIVFLLGFLMVLFFIDEQKQAKKMKVQLSLKKSIKNMIKPVILLSFFITFMLRLARTMIFPFLPLIVQENRNSLEGAAPIVGMITAIVGVATALAGITLARFGDQFNKKKLIGVLLGLAFLFSTLTFATSHFYLMIVFYIVVVYLLGGVDPILQSLNSENTSADARGILFGIQTTVMSIAWGFSPLLGSQISIHFGLKSLFVGFAIILLPTFVLSLFFIFKKSKTKI
ncbi:MAG: MFS transporter [Spirochaetes bacterium]|nr:MFS transporter [Spirochaetota bacterium]